MTDPYWHKVIHDNARKRIDPLTFRKEHGDSEEVVAAIEILHLYHKARVKLPRWVEALAAMNSRAYEQSSSEEAASFKASLFHGNTLLNLSGGLGVDDVAFSGTFDNVVSIDLDPDVHEMAEYNMKMMGIGNVKRICSGAEEYLEICTEKFDLIYIDPDRRPGTKGKVADLRESDPCVPELEEKLFGISDRILTKISPMYDQRELERVLSHVSDIYVVSVRNEVKEVLSLQEKGYAGRAEIHAIDIDADGNLVRLNADGTGTEFTINEAGEFLYESGSTVVKAGLENVQQQYHDLDAASSRGPFFYGRSLIRPFLGRTYRILWKSEVKWDVLKKRLKNEGWTRASVTAKDFYLKPKDILRKIKMKEGGETQLIFTKDVEGRPVVIAAERVS